MPKLLVLVLSSQQVPYEIMQRLGQDATWVKQARQLSVPVVRYFAGERTMVNRLLSYGAEETFWDSGVPTEAYTARLQRALRHVLKREWDYLFRTNSSTWVNIPALQDRIARANPSTYAGFVGQVEQKPGERAIRFASGAGFLVSRDLVVQISKEGALDANLIDDVAVGLALEQRLEVSPLRRIDVTSPVGAQRCRLDELLKAESIRCKARVPRMLWGLPETATMAVLDRRHRRATSQRKHLS